MDFDWNDLPYFIAVAETGNLSRAAARLQVNHSTVFRRLQSLEARLGVRLFERQPEGYLLTQAGELALQQARLAEEAVGGLRRRVAGQDVALHGQVRMTTAPKLATDYVAPALAALAAVHPGIRVEVLVSDSDYDLSRREADLALRASSQPPQHLVGRLVARLPWLVVAGADYLKRHGTPQSMAELEQHPLIGSDQTFTRLLVFDDLHRRYAPERFAATANDLTAMAAMARAGLGLAVLPADQLGPGLVPLFPVQPTYATELWMLSHPDLRRVARVRAVTRFLYRHLRQDPRIAAYVPANQVAATRAREPSAGAG